MVTQHNLGWKGGSGRVSLAQLPKWCGVRNAQHLWGLAGHRCPAVGGLGGCLRGCRAGGVQSGPAQENCCGGKGTLTARECVKNQRAFRCSEAVNALAAPRNGAEGGPQRTSEESHETKANFGSSSSEGTHARF